MSQPPSRRWPRAGPRRPSPGGRRRRAGRRAGPSGSAPGRRARPASGGPRRGRPWSPRSRPDARRRGARPGCLPRREGRAVGRPSPRARTGTGRRPRAGPAQRRGDRRRARWVAANADPHPATPTMRSIQPVRRWLSGAASSISSIASKCERFAASMPQAWTAPSRPESQNGYSGAMAGCRPNMLSTCLSRDPGTAMDGRQRSRSGSPLGTTRDSPSMPPRSETTTSTSAVVAVSARATRAPDAVVAVASAAPAASRSSPRRVARPRAPRGTARRATAPVVPEVAWSVVVVVGHGRLLSGPARGGGTAAAPRRTRRRGSGPSCRRPGPGAQGGAGEQAAGRLDVVGGGRTQQQPSRELVGDGRDVAGVRGQDGVGERGARHGDPAAQQLRGRRHVGERLPGGAPLRGGVGVAVGRATTAVGARAGTATARRRGPRCAARGSGTRSRSVAT